MSYQTGNVIQGSCVLTNNLALMKADFLELKNENPLCMYVRGFKRKFCNSPCEAVNSVARVTFISMFTLVTTTGIGYCVYNRDLPILKNKVVDTGFVILLGVVAACGEFKNSLKREVANNIVHGYYDRVTQIIDHRIGSHISEESKKQVQKRISKLLSNTPVDQIEQKLVDWVTETALEYI